MRRVCKSALLASAHCLVHMMSCWSQVLLTALSDGHTLSPNCRVHAHACKLRYVHYLRMHMLSWLW